jgi:hypothetical protein
VVITSPADHGDRGSHRRAVVRPGVRDVPVGAVGPVTLTGRGVARLTVVYQRHRADGTYRDVANTRAYHSSPVAATIPVISR